MLNKKVKNYISYLVLLLIVLLSCKVCFSINNQYQSEATLKNHLVSNQIYSSSLADIFEKSVALSRGIQVDGKVSVPYMDCYTIMPEMDSNIVVRISQATPLSIYLYDENEELIKEETNSDRKVTLRFYGLKDKKYFLIILGLESGNCEYSVKFDYFSTEDDYGNTMENAYPIFINDEIKGSTNFNNDCDYFSFTPSSDGKYFIENLSFITDTSYTPHYYLVFNIYDSDGKMVYTSTDYHKYVYFDLIKNNTYYVLITNKNYSSYMDYSFSLKGPVIDDCGNSFETAKEIKPGEKLSGSLDYFFDSDYFKFVPSESGRYYLKNYKVDNGNDISKIPELGSIIELFDGNGNGLRNIYFGSENIIFDIIKDHECYIKISDGYELFNYSLDFEGPFEDDYGNFIETATEISLNKEVHGKVNYYDDLDYLSFTPSTSGKYYFKLDCNFNYYLTVRENNYSYETYEKINNNIMMFKLLADTKYYIIIGDYDTEEGGIYKLAISDKVENLLPETVIISGYVKPEFSNEKTYPSRTGFLVSLKDTDLFAYTDENGYFQLPNVPVSDQGYVIEVSKNGYLSRMIHNVIADRDILIAQPIEVWAGDIDSSRDGIINMLDVLVLAKTFNTIKNDPDFMESADINGDFVINILDVFLMAKHFNQTINCYPQIF
ncbi:dockerin type I domain-containing protein [Pseudobacteroides cellulosolvens]|uniref:dockerin type I domain-containing protein n=1 Tax=Pseudobacteroides cellulosolvens TaxID=35825 RepID=UPI00056AB309|nr:dockerin type I domain-containing protein [Pseudobacteroides cellulosolvens]